GRLAVPAGIPSGSTSLMRILNVQLDVEVRRPHHLLAFPLTGSRQGPLPVSGVREARVRSFPDLLRRRRRRLMPVTSPFHRSRRAEPSLRKNRQERGKTFLEQLRLLLSGVPSRSRLCEVS